MAHLGQDELGRDPIKMYTVYAVPGMHCCDTVLQYHKVGRSLALSCHEPLTTVHVVYSPRPQK